jgi:hypothetical protein
MMLGEEKHKMSILASVASLLYTVVTRQLIKVVALAHLASELLGKCRVLAMKKTRSISHRDMVAGRLHIPLASPLVAASGQDLPHSLASWVQCVSTREYRLNIGVLTQEAYILVDSMDIELNKVAKHACTSHC